MPNTSLAAQPQIPQSGSNTNQKPQYNFKPNILDSTANYTYHIRWSMCTEQDSENLLKNGKSSQFRNNTNKIIIAESGITAQYNITDFTIETGLPASPTTPQTTEVKGDMTIVEPYGLTLTDNLFVASRGIGINNYLTSNAYFIDIWFKGYNEDGTPNTTLDEVYICWAVHITKLDSTTTESGTTYKIEFILHNMYGNADHVNCLPSSFTIAASNIGQFLDQLGQVWTEQNASLYEDKKPRITYKFQAPFARNWAFDKSPTTSQAQNSMTTGQGGIPQIQLGRGQDLVTILNFAISNTRDGQNFTIGEPSTGSSNSAGSASMKVNGMTNLIVVHTWSYHNGPFDPVCNDYPRTVIYTLLRYPTGRAIGNLQNAARTKQPGPQQQRQQALIGSGNYIKHYWWTYTGQNLDISKFELILNHMNQSGILNQLGYNTIGDFRVGPQLDNSSIGVAEENNLNPIKQATVGSGSNTSTQLNQNVSLNGNPASTATSVNTATASQNATNVAAAAAKTGSDIASAAAAKAKSFGQNNVTANNQATPVITLRKTSYLEDVGTSTFDPDPWVISGRATVTPITQNAVSGDSSPTKTNASAGPNNIQVSRSLVASILEQCKEGSLAQQKLEIRGDPYWLGFSNIDERTLIGDGSAPSPPNRDNSAWWFGGDIGYVFTMRTGTNYNESTGFMDLNNNTTMWNGYYKVVKLTSIFKAGVFTQQLDSMRDPLTNPTNVPEATSSSQQSNTTSVTNATLAQAGTLADKVIKAVKS
jgi:hypothetical protein